MVQTDKQTERTNYIIKEQWISYVLCSHGGPGRKKEEES